MKSISKPVTSNQTDIHENLEKTLSRLDLNNYQRPISEFSKETFTEIVEWIDTFSREFEVILDMGCGVGESSYHLACQNPDKLVIGVDRSLKRLETKNLFKDKVPDNLLLIRGELLDLWYLFATSTQFEPKRIFKQYILYPNPSPKSKDLKRRWHASPVAPYIFKLHAPIELRTNWKIYGDEFAFAAKFFGFSGELCVLSEGSFVLTPFERKYQASKHEIFKLELRKN